MDEQIRLRDDMIFRLKQKMATQQQRIANLEHRNKKLEELSITMKGISIVPTIASACLFGVCVCTCIMCAYRR